MNASQLAEFKQESTQDDMTAAIHGILEDLEWTEKNQQELQAAYATNAGQRAHVAIAEIQAAAEAILRRCQAYEVARHQFELVQHFQRRLDLPCATCGVEA